MYFLTSAVFLARRFLGGGVFFMSRRQRRWFKRWYEYFASTHQSGGAIFALWCKESKLSSFSGKQQQQKNLHLFTNLKQGLSGTLLLYIEFWVHLYPPHKNTSTASICFIFQRNYLRKATRAGQEQEWADGGSPVWSCSWTAILSNSASSYIKKGLVVLPSAVVKVRKSPAAMSS